jgi:hypothetical protein
MGKGTVMFTVVFLDQTRWTSNLRIAGCVGSYRRASRGFFEQETLY